MLFNAEVVLSLSGGLVVIVIQSSIMQLDLRIQIAIPSDKYFDLTVYRFYFLFPMYPRRFFTLWESFPRSIALEGLRDSMVYYIKIEISGAETIASNKAEVREK